MALDARLELGPERPHEPGGVVAVLDEAQGARLVGEGERAAALAKEAFKSGKTIRELCREQSVLPEATLNAALDPMSMTEPHA